jgi:2-oxoglutarate ferredoxin oxidoreductase subunit delta
VNFCPKQVFEMGRFYPVVANPQDCSGCQLCERLCPDFAITVTLFDEDPSKVEK